MKKIQTRQRSMTPMAMSTLVASACNLAKNDEISAVHVVSNERPAYDELVRYRRWADSNDLRLSAKATSAIFRSGPLPPPLNEVATPIVPIGPPNLAARGRW